MKKVFLPVSFLTAAVVAAGILAFQAGSSEKIPGVHIFEIVYVSVLILFFIVGIYFSVKRIKSRNEGFPEEDELSKSVTRKAGSVSFYVSVFLWLIILYMLILDMINSRILLGFGIAAMAVIFLVSWIVISVKGTADA